MESTAMYLIHALFLCCFLPFSDPGTSEMYHLFVDIPGRCPLMIYPHVTSKDFMQLGSQCS